MRFFFSLFDDPYIRTPTDSIEYGYRGVSVVFWFRSETDLASTPNINQYEKKAASMKKRRLCVYVSATKPSKLVLERSLNIRLQVGSNLAAVDEARYAVDLSHARERTHRLHAEIVCFLHSRRGGKGPRVVWMGREQHASCGWIASSYCYR